MRLAAIAIIVPLLVTGCTGFNEQEQRVITGGGIGAGAGAATAAIAGGTAAVGAAVGGPVGAIIGYFIAKGAFAEQGFGSQAALPESAAAASTEAEVQFFQPVDPNTFLAYFSLDGTGLQADDARTVERAAARASQQGSPRVSVTGHTDRAGSSAYNMQLSRTRAQHVRDVLVSHGVASERISVAARGETEPVVPTADGVVEPRNRRVEIVVE